MRSKRVRDALGRAGNLSLAGQMDVENWGQVDDEHCHAHSDYLKKAWERLEKQGQDRQRIVEFTRFVRREGSGIEPAIGAIFATGSHGDAAEFLGITDAGFSRMRTRLLQLGRCFENGEPVPRQRKPYKKRRRAAAILSLAAA
jgi:hypothetical protein